MKRNAFFGLSFISLLIISILVGIIYFLSEKKSSKDKIPQANSTESFMRFISELSKDNLNIHPTVQLSSPSSSKVHALTDDLSRKVQFTLRNTSDHPVWVMANKYLTQYLEPQKKVWKFVSQKNRDDNSEEFQFIKLDGGSEDGSTTAISLYKSGIHYSGIYRILLGYSDISTDQPITDSKFDPFTFYWAASDPFIVSAPENLATTNADYNTQESDFSVVSVHHAKNVSLYDEFDRRTGLNANGDIELGIPNSDYFTIEESTFITGPPTKENGRHKILIVADKRGSIDIKTEFLVSENSSRPILTITYLDVIVSTTTKLEFTYGDDGQVSNIRIDRDGNGIFEAELPPTAILYFPESLDDNPPKITLGYFPEKVELGQQIKMEVDVRDDLSGVAYVKTFVDEREIGTNDPITFQKTGEHEIVIVTSDMAGNPRTLKRHITID